MNEAMKMEESHVEELGNFSLNYFNEVLTPDFVKELMGIFGVNSKYLIKEFIFGMDVLVEMVNSPVVPMKCLLNNVDVTDAFVFQMKNKAIMEGKSEFYGCQVGASVTDLINEFFERKYLRLFNYVLSETRYHLIIPFDGVEYRLSINKTLNTDTRHCSINFKRMDYEDRRIAIPFHFYRLVE